VDGPSLVLALPLVGPSGVGTTVPTCADVIRIDDVRGPVGVEARDVADHQIGTTPGPHRGGQVGDAIGAVDTRVETQFSPSDTTNRSNTRMRRTLATLSVSLLALSMTGVAALADDHLPSNKDVLDSDSVTVDVTEPFACPAPPEGVDIVGADDQFYRIRWNGFDPQSVNLLIRDEVGKDPVDQTDDLGADGNAYFWNPETTGRTNADQTLIYYLTSGDIERLQVDFDDDGCMLDYDWTSSGAAVSVAFTAPDGHVSLEAGESQDFEVTTTNNNASDEFPNQWQLALEVTGDVTSADDITLSGGLEFTLDGDILYVYGLVEDERLGSDVQSFTATFHEAGQFTGTVYVLNTGELHPAVLEDWFGS
jgi:hypothetical protein